jgi:hypothetical protein
MRERNIKLNIAQLRLPDLLSRHIKDPWKRLLCNTLLAIITGFFETLNILEGIIRL